MPKTTNLGGSASAPAVGNTPSATGGSSGTTGGTVTGLVNTGLSPSGVRNPMKHGFQNMVAKRLDGVKKFLPAGISLVVNGQHWTQPSILQLLQIVVDLFEALNASKVSVGQARLALSAELPTAHQFITGLDHALIASFGKGNAILANFGVASGARKQPTSTTDAEAAAKAKLTRKARHTMGKKARLEIKGGGASGQVTPAGSPDVTPASASNSAGSNGTGNGGGTPSAK